MNRTHSLKVRTPVAVVARPLLHDPKLVGGEAHGYDPLTPTIFHEDWWLNVATGGNFDVAEVRGNGATIGRLPFSVTRRFGIKTIRMPALTHFLGPGIDEGQGGPNTRFLKRLKITRELIEKLPRSSWQYVKCHSRITDVIAFQESGFRTYVQFTHELKPDSEEILWQQLRNKTRNVIRKAQERFSATELTDTSEFVRLFEDNLALKGMHSGVDGIRCRNIVSASLDRHRGRILVARDGQRQIVAANFCVWDASSTFYLLSTRCGDSGNSAGSLLLWEAIKESSRRGLTFDFAGLGNKGSVLLYSGFGASAKVRFVALRSRGLSRVLSEVKSLFTPENFFF
jgi:Acetyltransferase (GNAT) domain